MIEQADSRHVPGPPALEARNLSVEYDGTPALRDVSVAVSRGEFVSVLGPNGAGKTTLIKALTGVLREMRGEVLVLGRPLRSYRRPDLGRTLAFLPQATPESLPFTVHDLVMMGRFPYLRRFEMERPRDGEIVRRAMELMGVERFGNRYLMELSGGEVKRVYIAQAIAQESDILVLDEPTANLDINYQVEIFRMLQRFNREMGKTIVLVTHDVNHAARFTPRVVLLKEGRIVRQGPSAEVITEPIVRSVFNTEVRIRRDEDGRPYLIL